MTRPRGVHVVLRYFVRVDSRQRCVVDVIGAEEVELAISVHIGYKRCKQRERGEERGEGGERRDKRIQKREQGRGEKRLRDLLNSRPKRFPMVSSMTTLLMVAFAHEESKETKRKKKWKKKQMYCE